MVTVWNQIKLGDCCDFIGGGTPSKSNEQYWKGNIPWISSADITEDKIKSISITRFITNEAVRNSATHLCPQNTINVVSRVGVGKVAISQCELCTSQDFTNLIPRKHDICYLAYYLSAAMKKVADGAQGTSIKGITTDTIKSLSVPIPPKDEQQAIATALSDVDELIADLEKLIEKKRAIKQGTMQELLTGKRRLPGFTGEWKKRRIDSFLTIGHGKDYKGLRNGTIPVYGTGGYMTSVDSYLYDGATVCIGRKGTIDVPQYHEGKIWTVDTLFYTHSFSNAVPKFVYYLFCLVNWNAYNEASGVPSLTAKTIGAIELMMPGVKEQEALSGLLSDMEEEINVLQTKLDKYRAIKQGMMQKLLTGEIRLV